MGTLGTTPVALFYELCGRVEAPSRGLGAPVNPTVRGRRSGTLSDYFAGRGYLYAFQREALLLRDCL